MSDTALSIFGIGSPHGDDRFGWEVVRRLKQRWSTELNDIGFSEEHPHKDSLVPLSSPVDLLNHLNPQGRVVICDACRGLSAPGDLRSFDWPDESIEHLSGSGTHDFSLADTLRLAARLQRLPPGVTIWVAEGSPVMHPASVIEEKLSPPVTTAVDELVSLLTEEYSHA